MNKKELEVFAKEAAKNFKTEKDFSAMLKAVTVEASLARWVEQFPDIY